MWPTIDEGQPAPAMGDSCERILWGVQICLHEGEGIDSPGGCTLIVHTAKPDGQGYRAASGCLEFSFWASLDHTELKLTKLKPRPALHQAVLLEMESAEDHVSIMTLVAEASIQASAVLNGFREASWLLNVALSEPENHKAKTSHARPEAILA